MPKNDTAEVVIRVRPALQSSILRAPQNENAVGDTTVCFGSELQLFAKGFGGDSANYSFEWLVNDSLIGTQEELIFIPILPSPFTLHLVTNDACSPPDTTSINITVLPSLQVAFTAPDTLCIGEAITLVANGTGGIESTYSYEWFATNELGEWDLIGSSNTLNFKPSTVNNSPLNTQHLKLILSDGCSSPNDTFTHTFVVRPPLELTLSAANRCANPSTTITTNPSGGKPDNYVVQWLEATATGQWNPIGTGLSTIVTPTQLTTYRAVLTDGCSADTAFAQIQIDRLPSTLTLTATPTEGCEPLEVEFEINTNYSDTFSGILFVSDTDSLMIANPLGRMAISRLASGTYIPYFKFISKLGCTAVSQFNPTITVHPKPMAAFRFMPDSPRIDRPEVLFRNLSTGGTRYQWEIEPVGTFTDFEPSVTYTDTGLFPVMHIAISAQGCRDTAVGEVWIQKVLRFFMPNAFSPNGDGINDGFFPSVLGLEVMEFNIYNGWGERMFRSNGQAWDGTYRGLPVPSGVYTYILVLKEENGKQLHFSGTVTLIR
jgi:gliding motility-associated-like protein